MPAISVVLPVYNGALFLREAVQSIFAQHHADFELIAIDDGSTDDSYAILESFRDPRLRLYQNPANLGMATSFNIGFALARGEFVARMDADDIAEPQRLGTQFAFMRAQPDIVVCGSDVTVFGMITSISDVPAGDGDIKAQFVAAAGNILNPTAFLRRQFLIDHHIRANPNYYACNDLALWIDCMRMGARFANIKAPLLRYRTHPQNASLKQEINRRDVNRILTTLLAYYFPALTPEESALLLRICGTAIAVSRAEEVPALLAVVEKALSEKRSFFGESRARIATLLRARFSRILHEMKGVPHPHPSPLPQAGEGGPA